MPVGGKSAPNARDYRYHIVSSLSDTDHVRVEFVLRSEGESWWIHNVTSR